MKKLLLCILILSGSLQIASAQLIHVQEDCNSADISLYKYKYKIGLTQADAVIYKVSSIAQARMDYGDGRWYMTDRNMGVKVCFEKFRWDADFTIYVTDGIAKATIRNDKLREKLLNE